MGGWAGDRTDRADRGRAGGSSGESLDGFGGASGARVGRGGSGGGSARAALLLVGHGTRDERGLGEFWRLADQVRAAAGGWLVVPCFLEAARPSVGEAVAEAAGAGAERVVAAPLLLLPSGHARRDLPAQLGAAAARFPGLAVVAAPPLGDHPATARLSADRFTEACAANGWDPVEAGGVLAARGGRDADLPWRLARFAARRPLEGVAPLQIGFLGMARPTLEEAMERAAASGRRAVVVQPHLLFRGRMADQFGRRVAAAARRLPGPRWIAAAPLGPSPSLVRAVLDNAAAAMRLG